LSRPLRLGAYVLVALFGAFELGVLWLAIHPNVPPDYRAYYLDWTTTCMNQPVSGETDPVVVSFLPEGRKRAKLIKACGWEGPTGDGTHALGTSGRLRLALTSSPPDPVLALTMIAIDKSAVPEQRVQVTVNGQVLDELEVGSAAPQEFLVKIPAALVSDHYEVMFDYPDAQPMGPTDPQTRWRSIKLLAAGIVGAADPKTPVGDPAEE
jgi:hypothetical protein